MASIAETPERGAGCHGAFVVWVNLQRSMRPAIHGLAGEQPGWTPFSFTLSVPNTDCRAQLLQLQAQCAFPVRHHGHGQQVYLAELKIIKERVAGASEGSQAQ